MTSLWSKLTVTMIFKTQKQKSKLASDYILNDDLEGLRKLFEKGFDPNSEAINGESLWMYAIDIDNDEAYSLIKEYKALKNSLQKE